MHSEKVKNSRPAIVIRVMGGLASQMHKYAIGRLLADKHNCELLLDLTWFEKPDEKDTKRDFLLDKFNSRFVIADIKTIKYLQSSLIRRKLTTASRKMGLSNNFLLATHYIRGYTASDVLDAIPPIYIEGEWFGGDILKENRYELLRDFNLRETLSNAASKLLVAIHASESISIHVRRGDFIHNSAAAAFHHVTDINYYEAAIARCTKNFQNPLFFIFSDDQEWTKENFSKLSANFIFIENNTPYEDMFLMKNCQHQIIANSGFGWFGAWLNPNDKKMLIAPKLWVKNELINANICQDLASGGFRLI